MNNAYLLSKLLIFGCKALTVAAPWGIKLNKDITLGIIDNLVEVLSNNNL